MLNAKLQSNMLAGHIPCKVKGEIERLSRVVVLWIKQLCHKNVNVCCAFKEFQRLNAEKNVSEVDFKVSRFNTLVLE